MNYFKKLITSTIPFLISGILWGQVPQLSGIINTYHEVTGISSPTSLQVNQTTGLQAGDDILIIQMKGAVASTANNAGFGDVTDYRDAGHYEFVRIAAIQGQQVDLESALQRSYDPGTGTVQVVSVVRHPQARIAGTVTGQAWNGHTGGVIALAVCDSLFLDADIDATGIGFRGGARSANGYYYSNTYISTVSTLGRKGESIVEHPTNWSARGHIANAGGGGHYHNSGGGGGGAAGQGGNGGSDTGTGVPGIGGQALNYQDRLFLGGGGGGGQQNDNHAQNGAIGGGIVILQAGHIAANGGHILAKGASPVAAVGGNNDGGGGGGGGGAVVISATGSSGNLMVNASGGNSIYVCCVRDQRIHGAGGGGGGGFILHDGLAPGSSLVADGGIGSRNAPEGFPGIVQNGQPTIVECDPCLNSDLVALSSPGATVYPAWADSACTEVTASAAGGLPPYSYLWSNGSTSASTQVCPGVTTTYEVTVTDGQGCEATSQVRVCAVDIRCGNAPGNKIRICHQPPGNPANTQQLCLPAPAVPAHLAHGDYLGNCGAQAPCGPAPTARVASHLHENANAQALELAPHPFGDRLTLHWPGQEIRSILLMDLRGRQVFSQNVHHVTGTLSLNLDGIPAGTYLLQVRSPDQSVTKKVIKR